jgi:hypothetical protein
MLDVLSWLQARLMRLQLPWPGLSAREATPPPSLKLLPQPCPHPRLVYQTSCTGKTAAQHFQPLCLQTTCPVLCQAGPCSVC